MSPSKKSPAGTYALYTNEPIAMNRSDLSLERMNYESQHKWQLTTGFKVPLPRITRWWRYGYGTTD